MRLFLWFSNTVTLCFFISVSMLTMWEPQVEAEHLWMATQAWSYKVQVFQCVGSLSCIDLTRTMKSTRQDRCRGPLPLPAKSGKPRCKQSFDLLSKILLTDFSPILFSIGYRVTRYIVTNYLVKQDILKKNLINVHMRFISSY